MGARKNKRKAPNNNSKRATRSQRNVAAAEGTEEDEEEIQEEEEPEEGEETEEQEEEREANKVIEQQKETIGKLQEKVETLERRITQNVTTRRSLETVGTLTKAEKSNLSTYIHGTMFKILPLPTDATFKAQPWIIDKCLDKCQITDPEERLAKRSVVEKVVKDKCSDKRNYIQKLLQKKYAGE